MHGLFAALEELRKVPVFAEDWKLNVKVRVEVVNGHGKNICSSTAPSFCMSSVGTPGLPFLYKGTVSLSPLYEQIFSAIR